MFRSVSFPIVLSRPSDPLILGARMAVADVLRLEAKAAIARGTSAGMDALTLGQRLVMNYVNACRGSRFLRSFPASVARWCFEVEQASATLPASEAYPAPQPNCVGGYNAGWITVMPNRTILISAGGVRAAGTLMEGDVIAPHEVREVRLFKSINGEGEPEYQCMVIMSSDSSRREGVYDPAEPELETEDL